MRIIEVENKSSLTIKILLLQSYHTEIFSKGLPKILVKNWKLPPCLFFFFGKISLEIMSDDHLVKSSQSKVLATVSLSTNYSAV